MSSTKLCRDALRKEILNFTKGKDLKQNWKIEKKVIYNNKEYPNVKGHKCDDDSGMWKMGTEISKDDTGGYYMIHYTVCGGVVTWNAEMRFNSKMTCLGGYINYFTGRSQFMKGKEMCDDYLKPFLQEKDEYITSDQGFKFITK